MTRTRLVDAYLRHAQFDAMFAQFVSKSVYGGCDACEAYQTVHKMSTGCWRITVHHDDWCPDYAEMT